MKVAIVYSGQYRVWSGWQHNHKMLWDQFDDCDIIYSTWESDKDKIPWNEPVTLFPDPVCDYNPFLIPSFVKVFGRKLLEKDAPKRKAPSSNFQQLAHFRVCEMIDSQEYDLIIRMRYDTILGDHDWTFIAKQVISEKVVVGIGNNGAIQDQNNKYHQKKPHLDVVSGKRMLDFMIMHVPSALVDCDALHERKELYPQNAGWYQVLRADSTTLNYSGGIQLKRYTK
tara:strand:+ start:2920 stop:3597 length:678 start_codon:yes stop_codon:yes gene_type:complete